MLWMPPFRNPGFWKFPGNSKPDMLNGTKTPGWFPTGFNKSNTGRSSNTTIAGLDQRVFRVTVDGSNTHIQRETTAPPTLPMRRALPLSNIEGSLAVEVKKRPTFFDWYSAAVVDWRWGLTGMGDHGQACPTAPHMYEHIFVGENRLICMYLLVRYDPTYWVHKTRFQSVHIFLTL